MNYPVIKIASTMLLVSMVPCEMNRLDIDSSGGTRQRRGRTLGPSRG